VALSKYAKAELLVFQNKLNEAIDSLTLLGKTYPENGLQDDILYLKAKLFEKKRDYVMADSLYQEIIEKYPEEIRADNALYSQAQLYEHQLNDLEKAKACYEKLFMEYTDSTFAIDARKRYRELRGDFESEPEHPQ
jgi:TolA-binding protein